MTKWIEDSQIDPVVVSSRIRLARNLKNDTFPLYSSKEEAIKTLEKIRQAVDELLPNGEYVYYNLEQLEPREKMRFMENHLISPGLVEQTGKSAFYLRNDEKATIMINEEDHLRLQTLYPGLKLNQAWEECEKIDDLLESKLDYAFHNEYGYLTSCPTNVGTGLRASVMLHLPAMTITGYIMGLMDALRRIGLTIRGIYGEGTEAVGHLYQVSNQLTLGETETEIIKKIDEVANEIRNREQNTRNFLLENKKLEIEDKVYRALGILQNARMISSNEAMEQISIVKLGLDLKLIEDEKYKDLIKLMIDIKPGNIQNRSNKAMNRIERDIMRADIVRNYFS
ncbi:MAG: protein arginine kinase [Tissierellales bacterium]|nr:protein arginine kinase [Tissierellales bacterium]